MSIRLRRTRPANSVTVDCCAKLGFGQMRSGQIWPRLDWRRKEEREEERGGRGGRAHAPSPSLPRQTPQKHTRKGVRLVFSSTLVSMRFTGLWISTPSVGVWLLVPSVYSFHAPHAGIAIDARVEFWRACAHRVAQSLWRG